MRKQLTRKVSERNQYVSKIKKSFMETQNNRAKCISISMTGGMFFINIKKTKPFFSSIQLISD